MVAKNKVFHQKFPRGEGRRFDYAFDPGDSVTSFYDPMIGKLIVHAEDREAACKKMIEVLQETEIFGIQTNIDFLVEIINHPEFFTGVMTTGIRRQKNSLCQLGRMHGGMCK